jgi:hypothetical protein
MSRFLLALSLTLFATVAMANDVANTDDAAAAAKQGKNAAVAAPQDSDATASPHAAATPTRSSSHGVSPRWHSLLPGMIR